jgi:hypothetical protein
MARQHSACAHAPVQTAERTTCRCGKPAAWAASRLGRSPGCPSSLWPLLLLQTSAAWPETLERWGPQQQQPAAPEARQSCLVCYKLHLAHSAPWPPSKQHMHALHATAYRVGFALLLAEGVGE